MALGRDTRRFAIILTVNSRHDWSSDAASKRRTYGARTAMAARSRSNISALDCPLSLPLLRLGTALALATSPYLNLSSY